jgi:O-antigen ligase
MEKAVAGTGKTARLTRIQTTLFWLALYIIVAVASREIAGGRWKLAPVVLLPTLLLYAFFPLHMPEIFVGLLQGGMGIVWFALDAVGLVVSDGWTLLLFSVVSIGEVIYCLMRRPQRLRVFLTSLSILVFLQGLLIVMGAMYSWNAHAVPKAQLFVAGNLVSFAVAATLGKRQRKRLYGLLLVVAVTMAVGAYLSFLTGGLGSARGRYGAFGIDTIGTADLIGLGIVLLLSSGEGSLRRMFLLLFLSGGVLLAATRSVIVSIVGTALVLGALSVKGQRRHLVRRIMLLCGSAALAFVLVTAIQEMSAGIQVAENWGPYRMIAETTPDNANIQERIQHIRVSLRDFAARPLFGWGTAGYGGSDPARDPTLQNWPHNLTLEILSESGLLGFAVYGLLLIQVCLTVRRSLVYAHQYGDRSLDTEVILLVSLFTFTLLDAQFRGRIGVNRTIWLAMGLLARVQYEAHRDSHPGVSLSRRSGFGKDENGAIGTDDAHSLCDRLS